MGNREIEGADDDDDVDYGDMRRTEINAEGPPRSSEDGWTKKWALGFVNFAPAVACHFCFNLPENFSQPGAHYLSQPCRAVSAVKYGLSELRQGEERLWKEGERERMAGSTEISEEGQKVHKMGLEQASPHLLKLALYLSRGMLFGLVSDYKL